MTQAEIRDLVAGYLDEDRTQSYRYVSDLEIRNAINAALLIYCFLTLAIEKIATVNVPEGAALHSLRSSLPDLILPLRITQNGRRIHRRTLREFHSLNPSWRTQKDLPRAYAMAGAGLLCLSPTPIASATSFQVTYAAFAARLNVDNDVPAIAPEDHHLIAYGAAAILAGLKLGGQFSAATRERVDKYMEGIKSRADFVRSRSRAHRYDAEPAAIAKEKVEALLKSL